MRRHRGYWRCAIVVVGSFVSGCAEELGAERFTTTRVVGVVRVGREPARGGWIEFLPVEGTVGNLRSAPIGRDGSFTADKVAVGRNVIGIVGAPLPQPFPRLFQTFRSPIRRNIPASSPNVLNLDLLEEALHARDAVPQRR